MNRRNTQSVLFGCAVLAALAGCATNPPAPIVQTTPIRCLVPTITALPETKEAQSKGGLEIGVAPAIYKAVRADKVTLTQAQPPPDWGSIIVGPGHQNQLYVRESTEPRLVTQPRRLEFSVRINNQLSRVFRGAGSVVQFNVDGKLIPFGETDYRDFIMGIVPPRNETQLKIYGPALDMLKDKGTIGIFLYDVVTATDEAGRTTEKQNFTWYFNYTTQTVEQQAQASSKEEWMDVSEYQRRITAAEQERILNIRRQLPQQQ